MSDRTQLDPATATQIPSIGNALRGKYAAYGALIGGASSATLMSLAHTFAYASSLVTGTGFLAKAAVALTALFAGMNFVLTAVGMLGALAFVAAGIYVGLHALSSKDFRSKLGMAQAVTYGLAALTVGLTLSGLGGPYALALAANAFNGSVAGRAYARWAHKPAAPAP